MPNRRWTEYLASLGLLGTEFGKAVEGVVGVPVTAHSAFEAAVQAASMALEGRRIQSTVHDDSSATLGRVVEVVPSFALPVMAAGRIAVWQRLGLELTDGSWQLEWMRRARPLVAWQLVTGRLCAAAEFLALAGPPPESASPRRADGSFARPAGLTRPPRAQRRDGTLCARSPLCPDAAPTTSTPARSPRPGPRSPTPARVGAGPRRDATRGRSRAGCG